MDALADEHELQHAAVGDCPAPDALPKMEIDLRDRFAVALYHAVYSSVRNRSC